jgi:NAD(P)-dependent dehydrogenase (short-subunit alcohol dehydrogenase family)
MSVAVNTVLPAGGVAFVTGGARGLGLAVALSFAREGCSAVTIIDVLSDDILAASKEVIEKAGAKVRCITH